ncbi:Gmp synthase [Daphnia magna]|uniref:Gmp synthase n=1 Tax=Daphnia magna TaxID=35525 RepID=A0A162P9G4_9CRUS|nr:Gmp synthase [Daphnia magna]
MDVLVSHLKLEIAWIADLESVNMVILFQISLYVHFSACLMAASSALRLLVGSVIYHRVREQCVESDILTLETPAALLLQ